MKIQPKYLVLSLKLEAYMLNLNLNLSTNDQIKHEINI
jgi:hypothetical protein